MKMRKRYERLATISVLTLLLIAPWVLSVGQEKSEVPQESQAAKYVGSDTCKTCHEDLYKNNFEKTPHFKTTLNDGHGCESCHGPGASHVEGGGDITKIFSFKTVSKQDANDRCLS